MTITRHFFVILLVAFLLVILFALGLTYQYSTLTADGTRLVESLKRTATLSQELASGNAEQSQDLRQQFGSIDPLFPERFRALNYSLGQKYTEYLKLDIGEQERLSVESAKAMQSEWSIVSARIFDQLNAGSRERAGVLLIQLAQLEGEMRDEFQKMNDLQTEKLRAVLDALKRTARFGYLAVLAFSAAFLIFLGVSTLLIRQRILRPILAILEASDRIRRGDFAARAPGSRMDEFGQLTQGFNFMAESLAESYANLEKKIEERTSELRLMQRQLIQAEKMSAVGQLVSGVAHELNNPLTTIMGFTELAKMEIDAGNTARSLELIKDVDSQAERCRRIVANLLQFSRRQEPSLKAVTINDSVEQVLRLREYELETRNIRLIRDFDPGNPIICADEQKIQQVLLNLLNNAHDAIREADRGGTIWVRTMIQGDKIILEMRDNGPGFRHPDKAFDPFYTTKEVGKGTGLGLSVCYGIVREHRGEIVARNWEMGAEVTVTLPIGNPEVLNAPPTRDIAPIAAPLQSAKRRALVVDDEKKLMQLQVSYLVKMGIDAKGVETGDEALQYLQDHDPDIIISDVRMPGSVDGVQLFEWVQENKPELAKRFLFASGDLMGLNLDEFFLKTKVARINKPFRLAEYEQAVHQLLESGGLPG